MPRPKVKPENRKRSVAACNPCRASKLKCDATYPCSSCIRRRRRDACTYPGGRLPSPALVNASSSSPAATGTGVDGSGTVVSPPFLAPMRTAAREALQEHDPVYAAQLLVEHATSGRASVDGSSTSSQVLPLPLPQAQNQNQMQNQNSQHQPQPQPQPQQQHHVDVRATVKRAASPDRTGWGSQSKMTQSRMLMSAKGEKVYVGAISSLSFLEFLRKIVLGCAGACPFTESAMKDIMLEVAPDSHAENTPGIDSVLDVKQKADFIQSYFEMTSAILFLYTKDELYSYLREVFNPSNRSSTPEKIPRIKLAALYLAMAIGAQGDGSSPSNQIDAWAYFRKGQEIAFEGQLCDPSLDMVRLFLLMAFYMLGACRRNTAFVYLGVASGAASTLGLHREEHYSSYDPTEVTIRFSSFKSLRILEILVSSILGRSASALIMRTGHEALTKLDPQPQLLSAKMIKYSSEICALLASIEQRLSADAKLTFQEAESLLQDLKTWGSTLPAEMRCFVMEESSTSSTPQGRELLAGATHIACSYYFAVILVARPFFITYLMGKLRERHPQIAPSENGEDDAKLAEACLESAVHMTQETLKAVESGMLGENMCIQKAWMFGAGLLLGFSLFANEPCASTRAEVEDSFSKAVNVLQHFSRLSPQAGHYHDILLNLSDAITRYREQTLAERRRESGHYVSRIFTIQGPPQAPPPPQQHSPSQQRRRQPPPPTLPPPQMQQQPQRDIQPQDTIRPEEAYQSPLSEDRHTTHSLVGPLDDDIGSQAYLNVNDPGNLAFWNEMNMGYQPVGMFLSGI